MFFNISIFCMWVAAGLNLWQAWRSIRSMRWTHKVREVLWAYEKELLERGVSLPPRCWYCCQVLPRHVEGCEVGKMYEVEQRDDPIMRRILRPPIKYFPKGEKPPDLGGKA